MNSSANGILYKYYLIVGFSVRIPRSKKLSESEQETRKLYIAAYMLPGLFRNIKRAALGYAVWSGFLRLRELWLLS